MPVHPLDNPIWTALTTTQQYLAQTTPLARKFPFEVSPLSALREPTREAADSLAEIVPPDEYVILFLESTPEFSSRWKALELGPMPQMVYEHKQVPPTHLDFIELTTADVPEMVALTALTKPGPFNQRTHELGDYIGIRREGKLAAMAGERMRVPGYTEVSAVCTHPDHLGHGYARGLMFEIMRRIIARGEMPVLHTRSQNQRAIDLYHHLGYTTRRHLDLAVLLRTSE